MQKLSRKKKFIMLLLVLSVLLAVGCSSDGNSLSSEESSLVLGINLSNTVDEGDEVSVQAIRDEFDLNKIEINLVNTSDSSDKHEKVLDFSGSSSESIKFDELTKDDSYNIKVRIKDDNNYTAYEASERATITDDNQLVTIKPEIVEAEGLIVDFKNISNFDDGKVILTPSMDSLSKEIELNLSRSNLTSIPANKYDMIIEANGEEIKYAQINLLPGRVTYVEEVIDLSDSQKNLGELDVSWGEPGPAISIGPDIERFISKLDLELYVEDNAAISKYTTDGSDPEQGEDFDYGDDITIEEDTTIKIYAEDADGNSSRREYDFTKAYDEYNPNNTSLQLGALYVDENETIFRIWSPDTSDVKVEVDGDKYELERINNFNGYTDIYDVRVEDDLDGKEYNFIVDGRKVRDPYGVMAIPDGDRNVVIDPTDIDPEGGWYAGDEHRADGVDNNTDAVIYEAHVRDFTHDKNSGVENRGKFMGMVEDGTESDEGHATGIDHLKELGITHAHIMPFYDFATEQYNWGYDPENYNVPENQYAVDDTDYEERIKEVKTMVNTFHQNGLAVIMDVTYNHTYNKEVLGYITDKYYTEEDMSGVGNSLDTAVPMVSRMIKDSLEYWASEYNLDGFRFDLMGIFHTDEIADWADMLHNEFGREVLLYGEPWAGMTIPHTDAGNLSDLVDDPVGAFNDRKRDAIRGDGNNIGEDRRGYMFNSIYEGRGVDMIAGELEGSFEGNAALPEQSINYVSKHDNFALWDKIRLEFMDAGKLEFKGTGDRVEIDGEYSYIYEDNQWEWKGESEEYAQRINKFAMGITMTAQGIPFIHAGDEMLRTKICKEQLEEHGFDHVASQDDMQQARNTYDQPDYDSGRDPQRAKTEVNTIQWKWKEDNHHIFEYYRDLIDLRSSNDGYRMDDFGDIDQYMEVVTDEDENVIISKIDQSQDGESDLITIYNPQPHTDEDGAVIEDSLYEYDISDDQDWELLFDHEGYVEDGEIEDNSVEVEATSIAVLKVSN